MKISAASSAANTSAALTNSAPCGSSIGTSSGGFPSCGWSSSSAVFWRPGLTAILTPWGNPRNDAPAVRLQQVKGYVSPRGFDHAEWSESGVHYLTYRLAEGAEDGRLPALYGFVVSTAGHVHLAVYFDSGDDLTSAQALVRSITRTR